MAKLPHMPLYYKDWLSDANLCRCTLQAKGLWIDLLCLMWDCEERGKLASGGTPWTAEDISIAIRGPDAVITNALAELVAKNVIRQDDKGCYYNSRMVKDEEIRKVRAESGSKGGSKTQANTKAKSKAKPKQNPANANATAIAIDNATKEKKKKLDFSITADLKKHQTKIDEWWEYRAAIKKPPKAQATITKMHNVMKQLGDDLPASVDHSIANGWTGLFLRDEKPGMFDKNQNENADLN